MSKGFVTFSLVLAGVFSMITAAGIWITDEPLMQLCRRECWINSLLYGMFGEFYGKAVYGGIGVVVGCALLIVSLYRMFKMPNPKDTVAE